MSSIQTDNQGSASPIEDGWLARVRYRKAVEADLREIEWEGAYSKYRQVYENVYQRAGSGLALMWVAELPEFGLIGQGFVQGDEFGLTDKSTVSSGLNELINASRGNRSKRPLIGPHRLL